MNIHITHVDNLSAGEQEYQADYDEHKNDGLYEILKHPAFDVEVAKIPRKGDSIIWGRKIYFVVNTLHNMNTISSSTEDEVKNGAGIVVHVSDETPDEKMQQLLIRTFGNMKSVLSDVKQNTMYEYYS